MRRTGLSLTTRRATTSRLHVVAVILAAVVLVRRAAADELTIWNGVSGPGSLTVTTDDYGSFGEILGWLDLIHVGPFGDPPGEQVFTEATQLFVFVDPSEVGEGTHRGVLSTHPLLLGLYQGNLAGTVTVPNALLGPDACGAEFTVTGQGVDLTWTLTQRVSAQSSGPNNEPAALLEQTYAITNTRPTEPLEFIVVKHLDVGLPTGGGPIFLDTLVGVDFGELGRAQVYAQDRELTVAALLLRTREDMTLDPRTVDFIYYVGIQNLPAPPGNPDYPGGECPPHDFGTDFQIWDNYGVPNCWKNFVPGVGYNVPGVGPTVFGDKFFGLQVEVLLPVGETYEVTFQTLYGFRPPPDPQFPPQFSVQTVAYDTQTGCGDFLWRLKNINPLIAGAAVDITEFYLDVEAGDGADLCTDMTPPQGWSFQLCQGFDPNNHALYKFTGGTPIQTTQSVVGRLKIDTNGLSPTTNTNTNITVPPLSVVLHAAQQQEDAACNFGFGPTTNGEWGLRATATAYLPVPAMNTWAKVMLALVVTCAGTILVLRSRRALVQRALESR